MTVYVYAVASHSTGRIRTRGITGEPLRAVTCDRIAALVGDVPRLPDVSEANLRAYHRTIQALSRRSAALLPARFGTVARDDAEVALILRSRYRMLDRQLKTVRRRVQMTVRLFAAAAGDHVPAVTKTGALRRARRTGIGSASTTRGRDYLRARADAFAHDQELGVFEPLRAAVRRWVRAERVEKKGAIASVYHLVPSHSAAAYRTRLERAAHEAGVRLVVTGPWPPYAFTNLF